MKFWDHACSSRTCFLLEQKLVFIRSKRSSNFFSTDGQLGYCNDIPELFESIDINYDPDDWRLFIDSSKESIKAVLLHNGNILPSVPVAYSTTLKES